MPQEVFACKVVSLVLFVSLVSVLFLEILVDPLCLKRKQTQSTFDQSISGAMSVCLLSTWHKQAVHCLVLSCIYQVFESVEGENPSESEKKAQEVEEKQESRAERSQASDTAELLLKAPSSPGLSSQPAGSHQMVEASGVSKEGPEPGQEGTTQSESKTEASGAQMVTRSDSVAATMAVVEDDKHRKLQEAAEKRGAANVALEDPPETEANSNSRLAPETTNVLRLETEIRNEYYQAPPLGQTLTLQAHKSKSDQDNSSDTSQPSEAKKDVSVEPGRPSENSADAQKEDGGTTVCDILEAKKVAELPHEKNSPVRQVLNALQSLSAHSRQSPDTADSDDSPSALEMEDIPAGITCVTSEEIRERPLVGLAAPPVSFAHREKLASADVAADHHMDTAGNTSPEGGLSEEEPELENVLAEALEAAEVEEGGGGGAKQYESEESDEQTYSVGHNAHTHFCYSSE